MSRTLVDFFERDVPPMFFAGYLLVGPWCMLFAYLPTLVIACLGMFIPVSIFNYFYGKFSLRLTNRLNDELEKEVRVIKSRLQRTCGHTTNQSADMEQRNPETVLHSV